MKYGGYEKKSGYSKLVIEAVERASATSWSQTSGQTTLCCLSVSAREQTGVQSQLAPPR